VTALIQTEKLDKVYNPGLPDEVTAVDSVSLVVNRGEVTAIKGPSGSGKTTLLSLMGCMGRPTAGRIVVDGKDVSKLPERFLTRIRRELFGFIFQQLHLIRDLSVLENVLLPLYPVPMRVAEMRRRAEEVLSDLGLSGKLGLEVRQLSGGEQQRVAVARALVNKPAIIMADEPTAHLDQRLARELMETLRELNESGKTVVIATHDPLVYENPFVHRRVEMRDGRIERVLES